MIDRIVTTGSMFDWITPLWTLCQDWRNRPSCGYSVPVAGGWSLYAIRSLLRSKGVKTWGWAIVDGAILFRARQAQAEYVQYWLARNAVPYAGGISKRSRTARRNRNRR